MLQLVSMLRRRIRRDELANVTIDSLSRSARGWVWILGRSDTCVLGANDVSAVSATYELLSAWLSPLRIERVFVVEPCDATSFNGTVLTLSETSEPASLPSKLATECDSGPLASGAFCVICRPLCLRPSRLCLRPRSCLSSGAPRFWPWTNRLTHPKRPRACRLSAGKSIVSMGSENWIGSRLT